MWVCTRLQGRRDSLCLYQAASACLGAVAQLPEHAKILGFRDEVRGDYAHAMPMQQAWVAEQSGMRR